MSFSGLWIGAFSWTSDLLSTCWPLSTILKWKQATYYNKKISTINKKSMYSCRKYPYPHHRGNWKFQGGGGGGGVWGCQWNYDSRRSSLMQCKLVSKSFLTYSTNVLHSKNSTLGSWFTIVLHLKWVFFLLKAHWKQTISLKSSMFVCGCGCD